MKTPILMILIVLLTCLTGCKTTEIPETPDPIYVEIPDPPVKPDYEFQIDREKGILYLTGEDGKRLVRYVTELKSYAEELRLIIVERGYANEQTTGTEAETRD